MRHTITFALGLSLAWPWWAACYPDAKPKPPVLNTTNLSTPRKPTPTPYRTPLITRAEADAELKHRGWTQEQIDAARSTTPITPAPTPARTAYATPRPTPYSTPFAYTHPRVAENGSYYGQPSQETGRPKTVYVNPYTRRDGTYVRGHYRSPPRR